MTFVHQRFPKHVHCTGCTVLGTGDTRPIRFLFWNLYSSGKTDNKQENKIKINVSAGRK